jgi:hypothetical protein
MVVEVIAKNGAETWIDRLEKAPVKFDLPAGVGPLYERAKRDGLVAEAVFRVVDSGRLIYWEDFFRLGQNAGCRPRDIRATWNFLLRNHRQLGIDYVDQEETLLNTEGVGIIASTFPMYDEEQWMSVDGIGRAYRMVLLSFRQQYFGSLAEEA